MKSWSIVYTCIFKNWSEFRNEGKDDPNPLLRTVVKPHKGASANTIAIWIKYIKKEADIDTNKFNANSTRGSSTSKANQQGISIVEILQNGWLDKYLNF